MKKTKTWLKKFFFPSDNAPRWQVILPYAVLGFLTLTVIVAGTYGWNYTNSPNFCADGCHTMPPQGATYEVSPHANILCTECHIGRAFVGTQLSRKVQDVRELYAMVTASYEFPIRAKHLFPARETCEQCHLPEKFSDDSLRKITHFAEDKENTPTDTYLIMKTGGGDDERGEQGLGIHWHVSNQVEYYATDILRQDIPFVRVHNEDGTTTDYIDIESDFDINSVDQSALLQMDCISCHNRISHDFKSPDAALDDYLALGLISVDIPYIRQKGREVLSAEYATREEGLTAIAALRDQYKEEYIEFYTVHSAKIDMAIESLQTIFTDIIYYDQKIDWETYPSNIGHVESPGCFRCHDGKHFNEAKEAVRLECNVCHSIPVVADGDDFITNIEISHGLEPEGHKNPNWIALHNQAFDATCANCHTVEDIGGTSNTSFCSNSACHGSAFTYAGFDAPALRELIADQLPPPVSAPAVVPTPLSGPPTYAENVAPALAACAACHNASVSSAGLDLSSYAGLMAGSENGAMVLPGDSENSQLVIVQAGQHFATLSSLELEIVRAWIDSGALDE
jgi:nitrate/TMAO reductase-like tetraheme cytochrome c subunit